VKIISSQRYIDENILSEKLEALAGKKAITLPAWEVGNGMAVLADGHHRLEAAKILGIAVEFEIETHPEGLTGDDLLEVAWMDSDWYYVKTGELVW
jgi:uncharacterized protein (DUF1015 family)